MTQIIAWLRGIDVDGRTLPMAEPCTPCPDLRWVDVVSCMESGYRAFSLPVRLADLPAG